MYVYQVNYQMPFNDFFKQLLSFKKNLITCSTISRSAKFLKAYQAWVSAQTYLNWTGPFFKAYHYQRAGMPAQLRVQVISEDSVKGALLFYEPSIGADNFNFLFDLLKDRVQQQGYKLHSASKLKIRHERYTEQAEKLLLTPPASDLPDSSLCNQLYGNILLDYIKVNKLPGYIRFATNSYNDAYFSKPLPFDELLELTLQPKEQYLK